MATVELATILPLLALLILGIIDLGMIIREYQVLQNAAREAARFSAEPRNWIDAVNPSANADTIRQRAVDYCAEEDLLVGMGDVTIDQRHPVVVGDKTIYATRVQVRYVRSLWLASGVLPFGEITLEGVSVFRNFY